MGKTKQSRARERHHEEKRREGRQTPIMGATLPPTGGREGGVEWVLGARAQPSPNTHGCGKAAPGAAFKGVADLFRKRSRAERAP